MLKYSNEMYTSSMPRLLRVTTGVSVLAMAAGAITRLGAQASVRTLVLAGAKDTISVERITRSPGRLEGDLLFRGGNQRWHYVATLSPDERVVSLDNEVRFATDLPTAPARQIAHLDFTGDSVFISITGPTAMQQRLLTRAGAIPYINPSFGLVEQTIRRGLAVKGDSLSLPMFGMIGGATLTGTMVRRGSDSVVFILGGVPTRLAVASDGTIRGGAIPAQGLHLDVTDGAAATAFFTAKLDYSPPAGAPYTAVSVRVPTPKGHTLAGTLTLPNGASGRVPAVVTITGSGPEDRDEAIPPVKGYRPFREVADALGRQGIAVLRMDDRGFGESEGVFTTATSEDFADDIRAGLAFLRARSDIDGSRLALLGHSEGGMIAPMVAANDPGLKGIVLMAGPGYTGRRILEYQNRFSIDQMTDQSPRARDSLMTVARKALDSLSMTKGWLGFFLNHDPIATAAMVRTPVLILQGATDRQVTADQAPVLEKAFRDGGNTDVTVHLYPETNHLFLPDPDGNPAGYSGLTVTSIRPEVLRDIVDWLTRRLR